MKIKRLTLALLCIAAGNSNAQVKISNGTHFIVGTGVNVIISGLSLQYNNSNLITNGNLIFSGSTDNSIDGTSGISRLTLAKTAGKRLILDSKITLSSQLILNSGTLDLNGHDLDLGNTGNLVNESNISYVTGNSGFVIANANLNSPSAVKPGNMGISFTSIADWGNTVIRRGHLPLSDGNVQTVKRFFDVIPSNNNNLDATLRFDYLDNELNGIQEDQLKFLFSEDSGLTWRQLNSTANLTENYLEISNLNSMGRFSSSGQNFTTLPISDIKLNGVANQQAINLSWNTINEVGVSHFIIEKSIDGQIFSTISKIPSKSSQTKDNSYSITDKNPISGTNYYRVRGIDTDGTETQSAILAVNFNLSSNEHFTVFPNPSTKLIKVRYYATNAQPVTLSVASSIGKTELMKVFQPQIGINEFQMDVTILPNGLYFLKLYNTTVNKSTKFIKN